MKALLLKDFYMMLRYCRMFFVIILVFFGVSLFIPGSDITAYFPIIFAGIIPVTLVSYDERENWHIYSATLPFTRAQIVSAKYLLGIITTSLTLFLACIVQKGRIFDLTHRYPDILLPALATFASSLVGTAIILTLIFKFGAEKGRIAFYVVIGVIFIISMITQNVAFSWPMEWNAVWFVPVTIFGSFLFFGGGWLLSIRFYEKRAL